MRPTRPPDPPACSPGQPPPEPPPHPLLRRSGPDEGGGSLAESAGCPLWGEGVSE